MNWDDPSYDVLAHIEEAKQLMLDTRRTVPKIVLLPEQHLTPELETRLKAELAAEGATLVILPAHVELEPAPREVGLWGVPVEGPPQRMNRAQRRAEQRKRR